MPLTNVLGNFFVIVLAGLGGWLALRDLVTVGIIATFISYGQNFISPLRQLANLYNAIQAALAGAERVFEIIDTPSEVDDAPDAASLESLRGDVRLRARQLRLPAGDADHQGYDAGGQSRADLRPGGADRRGQDDDHQPADPLLRDRRGLHHHRRQGHPRHQEGGPAPPAGARAAGYVPVLRHGDGEHPLWPAGRHRRGGDRGGQDGRRRSLHPPAAAGLPDRCSRSGPATSARASASFCRLPAPSWPTPAS